MKKLYILIFIVALTGCAGVAPNNKYDLSEGFYTYGFGRDIKVQYFENGKIKSIEATSNVGATFKAGETVFRDAAGLARQAMP